MVGQARVQEMEAKSTMDVKIAQAQGNLEVATAEGMKEAEEIRKSTQIACEERKVKVAQMANTVVVESEGQLRAAENNSKALIATASAENNSTAGLEVKRKYELEWQRLQILEVLAKEGRRFVTGEAGKQLLKDMVPGPSQMIKK